MSIPTIQPLSKRQVIARAKHHPDQHACLMVYRDRKGNRTARVISPAGYTSENETTITALCLARETYRNFIVSQIEEIVLVDANAVLMPVQIVELAKDRRSFEGQGLIGMESK